MSTTTELLNGIINAKEDLRQAITAKGGELAEGAKLRDYAEEVEGLESGNINAPTCRGSVAKSITQVNVSTWDTSSMAGFSMINLFQNFSAVKELDLTHLVLDKLTSIEGFFSGCTSLERIIINFNTPLATGAWNAFLNTTSLTTITGTWSNIRPNLNMQQPPLTRQSALVVINGLYDFSTQGGTHTLALKASTKALLTQEDVAIATSKGWTIA